MDDDGLRLLWTHKINYQKVVDNVVTLKGMSYSVRILGMLDLRQCAMPHGIMRLPKALAWKFKSLVDVQRVMPYKMGKLPKRVATEFFLQSKLVRQIAQELRSDEAKDWMTSLGIEPIDSLWKTVMGEEYKKN